MSMSRARPLAMMAFMPAALACSSAQSAPSDAGGQEVSGPHLTSLEVRDAMLVPPFSPATHDYYVQCAADANAFTVSMAASGGSTCHLLQPSQSAPAIEQTLPLQVNENDAIVAAATDGLTTEEYWIRCLPHDFPRLQMTLHPEAGSPTPGYYLVGIANVPPGRAGTALILDGNGVPIWYYLPTRGVG